MTKRSVLNKIIPGADQGATAGSQPLFSNDWVPGNDESLKKYILISFAKYLSGAWCFLQGYVVM